MTAAPAFESREWLIIAHGLRSYALTFAPDRKALSDETLELWGRVMAHVRSVEGDPSGGVV